MTTVPQFSISTAASNDVAGLHHLVNSAYRGESSKKGWTTEADFLAGQRIDEEKIQDLLLDSESQVLVAKNLSKEIIGCVHLKKISTDEIYLGMLTVSPTLQGGGLGKVLLRTSEKWAKENHAKFISMTVIAQRPELIQWYERRGYAKTGETNPFPYDDPRFGIPLRQDLYFVVLKKRISS